MQVNKLWAGKFHGSLNEAANDFNASIRFDSRMYQEDIQGSMAHAMMLYSVGILTAGENAAIQTTLAAIRDEIEAGSLQIDPAAEDIHSFIEGELTARIGEAGKKLHTARSRNDQVATDLRLYLRNASKKCVDALYSLVEALAEKADNSKDIIMPGYTHLQRAQPISAGHWFCAYAWMFLRDIGRINDATKRMNASPLGCCALAGTTFPIDRQLTASLLGFDDVCPNSLDGVSDRDFAIELASAFSVAMMHLSRMAEEMILWCSFEFRFAAFSDAFSTGSSIMPQKKNPDMAELIRGKSGRVFGDLMALLTQQKGLPLAYNKDMQEDKEAIFDAFDTTLVCLSLAASLVKDLTLFPDRMEKAAAEGFINATDCADYLTAKGVPFRTAYQLTGDLVAYCTEKGKTLEALTMQEYTDISPLFDEKIYAAVDLHNCLARRNSQGGTAPSQVAVQVADLMKKLEESKKRSNKFS